jgi:hypothetical protein
VEVISEPGPNGWLKAFPLGESRNSSRCRYITPSALSVQISWDVSEYPFAKYNVQNPVYTYTADEYTRFLTGKSVPYILDVRASKINLRRQGLDKRRDGLPV